MIATFNDGLTRCLSVDGIKCKHDSLQSQLFDEVCQRRNPIAFALHFVGRQNQASFNDLLPDASP